MYQFNTNKLLDGIDALDSIVFKTLKVSELTQLASIEVKDRRFLMTEWNKLVKEFVKVATPKLLKTATATQIVDIVNKIFKKFPSKVRKKHFQYIEEAYILARKAGWKKATGRTKGSLQYNTTQARSITTTKASKPPKAPVEPDFDLADKKAIKALKDKEEIWMGEHFKTVQEPIRQAAEHVITTGRSMTQGAVALSLSEAGQKVVIPDAFVGTQRQYFEGIVANAVGSARVTGQLRSFVDLGITTYTVVNPLDERTCPVCNHMEGKTFTINHGIQMMESMLEAKTKKQIKEAHPWYTPRQLKEISPKPGDVSAKDSQALANAGFAIPPFHFRCRCTIDISQAIGSFDDIANAPDTVDILGQTVVFGGKVK